MKQTKHFRYESRAGVIRLTHDEKTGVTTFLLKGGHQTAVDVRGISLDTYIHAIYGLLAQTNARSVLMIGCGGGTLGTMLTHIGKRVTIVDIERNAFKLASRHFHMPDKIICHVGDGLAYMQETRKRYDALILDAFIGEKIPKHMTGDELCQAARRCLRPEGAMFMNVCLDDRRDLTADKIAMRFRRNGWRVRMLDTPRIGARNGIILGGEVKQLTRPRFQVVPQYGAKGLKHELEAMRFRAVRSVDT